MIYQCGPGWKKLIDPLVEQCKAENVRIGQIKEKFGTLRFYIDSGASPALLNAIKQAEHESGHTCDVCGAKDAQLRDDGEWYRTRCDTHATAKHVRE